MRHALALTCIGMFAAAPVVAADGGTAMARVTVTQLIDSAAAAAEALEYEQAGEILLDALARADATDDERMRAHVLAGITHRVVGKDTEARISFLWVLTRDPSHKLPSGTEPRITNFYELVRSEATLKIDAGIKARFLGRPIAVPVGADAASDAKGGEVSEPGALLSWRVHESYKGALQGVKLTTKSLSAYGGEPDVHYRECIIAGMGNRCVEVTLSVGSEQTVNVLGFTKVDGKVVSVRCAYEGSPGEIPKVCQSVVHLR